MPTSLTVARVRPPVRVTMQHSASKLQVMMVTEMMTKLMTKMVTKMMTKMVTIMSMMMMMMIAT